MSLRVGSARIDERGKASGGKAGDQTGNEVKTEPYYLHSKGWYCFRPKDVKVAEAIANAMTQACNNNNIGYDQGQRTDVISALKKYGTLGAIAVLTEADCSSLVRACCIQAGFDPGNFNTASQPSCLEKTGKFMAKIAVTGNTALYNGDILVTKTKGHTVVVVSGSPRVTETKPGADTKVDSASYRDSALKGTYEVSGCGALNLRSGVGTGKNVLTTMNRGEKVTCYGFYNKAADGTKWLYVVYKNSKGQEFTGYASSKFLAKK